MSSIAPRLITLDQSDTNAPVSIPSSPMVVRQAKPEDAQEIAEVFVESFSGLLTCCYLTSDTERLTHVLKNTIQEGYLRLEALMVSEHAGRVSGAVLLQDGSHITAGKLVGYIGMLKRTESAGYALRGAIGSLLYRLFDARSPYQRDLFYVEAIAVRSDCRRLGIGSALLHAVEAAARDQRKSRIALHVISRRADARKMYERHGYKQSWRIPVWPLHTWPSRISGAFSAYYLEKRVEDITHQSL